MLKLLIDGRCPSQKRCNHWLTLIEFRESCRDGYKLLCIGVSYISRHIIECSFVMNFQHCSYNDFNS